MIELILAMALANNAQKTQEQTPKLPKQIRKFLKLTPQEISSRIIIEDDDFEVTAKVTTRNVIKFTKGIAKRVTHDNHIRAFIDKKTGETTYQVYQYISYRGKNRGYTSVNYNSEDGLQSNPVSVLNQEVISCSNTDILGGCKLSETIAFEVTRKQLEFIASKYSPDKPALWLMRFKSRASIDWDDGIFPIEIKTLLEKVDEYKKTLGTTDK